MRQPTRTQPTRTKHMRQLNRTPRAAGSPLITQSAGICIAHGARSEEFGPGLAGSSRPDVLRQHIHEFRHRSSKSPPLRPRANVPFQGRVVPLESWTNSPQKNLGERTLQRSASCIGKDVVEMLPSTPNRRPFQTWQTQARAIATST